MTNAGITMFVSSGDSGASVADDTVASTQFPAVLPYAVAVGATSFYKSSASSPIEEVVCSALDANLITSGGGYSTHFSKPPYQTPYLMKAARGVPDVAALGANLGTFIDGILDSSYGTSAAAPIVAAIMTLLNNRLRINGNETLRKAHEFFYSQQKSMSTSNGDGFTDITSGNNCGTRAVNDRATNNFPTLAISQCYFASTGWDATSGVGTPKFNNLAFALTGSTVAPNTPSPNAGNNDSSNSILDFINRHWLYFAIGGGVIVLFILLCCCYLKKRSDDKERRENLLFGGPNSARINQTEAEYAERESLSSRNANGARYGQLH